jgi:sterol desaturase/sphingolipid hydroxylase (fatty acid hydroxylase superfamily)
MVISLSFQNFFSRGQNLKQFFFFFITFLTCWNLEFIFGVSKNYSKWKHLILNSFFILPAFFVQLGISFLFIVVLKYENFNHLGLINLVGIKSQIWQTIFTFVLLDLGYWIYHFGMHKFNLTWRFHAVHHSDKVMDVSTSLREHPIETFIRLSFYMIIVWVLGPAIWIVTFHQFIQIVSKIIVHSNWRLPDKMDKYISYLFLTPNMHHVHHHYLQPYTDSNYGDLLSIWDRMFNTFYSLPKEKVVFGLDVDAFKSQSLDTMKFPGLLKVPFSDKKLSK